MEIQQPRSNFVQRHGVTAASFYNVFGGKRAIY